MSKEAMKLALEALKQIDEAMPFPVAKLAQAALREALAEQPAQQEQEPICKLFGTLPVYDRAAQQEPVAWMTKTGSVWKTKADETDEPLYTFPPAQRTWQGLTDEEINTAASVQSWKPFARAIEAKLKEKNNG